MTIALDDKRSLLHQLLLAYKPMNAADDIQRQRTVAFVEKNPQCFERTHLEGHITGSAWVVDGSGTKVLLTHHKKLNRWLQLGGHADGEPNIRAVALREAMEESGLSDLKLLSEDIYDVDVHLILERKGEPAHLHYDIRFLIQANGQQPLVVSDESNFVQWVEFADLKGLTTEDSLLRMARKYLSR